MLNSAPSGGWTLETLKIVVDGEISALRGVTDARSVAADARASEAKEAVTVGLAAAQTALAQAAILAKDAVTEAKLAHAAEHAALAMALSLAMLELKERLSDMNNFRTQIDNERSDFVTRDRLQTAISGVEAALATMVVSLDARFRLLETTQAQAMLTQGSDLRLALSHQATQIGVLERARSNLEGRFWAMGVGLAGFVVIIQFVFTNFKILPGGA
jgi:hypothetical protein